MAKSLFIDVSKTFFMHKFVFDKSHICNKSWLQKGLFAKWICDEKSFFMVLAKSHVCKNLVSKKITLAKSCIWKKSFRQKFLLLKVVWQTIVGKIGVELVGTQLVWLLCFFSYNFIKKIFSKNFWCQKQIQFIFMWAAHKIKKKNSSNWQKINNFILK